MPEEIQHNSINYHELAQAVQQERTANPEFAARSDKEILAGILARQTEHVTPASAPIPVPKAVSATDDDALPSYAANVPDDVKQQVRHLVAVTLEKGIATGLSHAKSLDPFAMDVFHDVLSEKLVAHLKEKQLL
ncbi:MAG: hypothetical protein WC246_02810 [Candidatus Paceibacterota bacterium]